MIDKTIESEQEFGLKKSVIDQTQKIFSQHPEIQKVLIYGSRAKGNFKNGSDIDLTMFGDNLPLQLQMDVFEELDELYLPYKIDLSIYSRLENENLKEHIMRVGKLFYQRS